MKNKKKSLIVEQNFSIFNSLQEQSEAEMEKKSSFSHCSKGEAQFDCLQLRILSISFNELIQFIH